MKNKMMCGNTHTHTHRTWRLKAQLIMAAMFMMALFKTDVGWGQYREIELGVSYDIEAVSQFSSEEELKSLIGEAVQICSDIYEANYDRSGHSINMWLARIQKINVNTNSSRTLSQSASFFWNSSADVCNTVDVAIHITGAEMPGEGGAWEDGFCITNRENSDKMTVGWVEVSSFSSAERIAFVIAHELGHQLGLVHENFGFSFMNEGTTLPRPFNSNLILLGSSNLNNFRTILGTKACLLEPNVNQEVEGCTNCEDKIIISRGTDNVVYDLDFGCGSEVHEFDHQLAFTNSCTQKRNVTIELEFHPDHITFTQLPDIFEGPFFSGSPSQRPYYYITKEPVELDENQGNVLDFSVRVGPGGHLGEQTTGAYLSVVYKLDVPGDFSAPGDDPDFSSIINQPYVYNYNFQIDHRNTPILQASQLQIPDPVDPLNFCFGSNSLVGSRSFDVYMGGELYIDMSQEYCKTHFFFPPGGRLVVGKNKSLTLNNCTLTTCDGLWEGIILEDGAQIIMNGTTISNAQKALATMKNISVPNKISIESSKFVNNSIGVDLERSLILKFLNNEFDLGITAIKVDDCSSFSASGIQVKNYTNGFYIKDTWTSLSHCHLTGRETGNGIVFSNSVVGNLDDCKIEHFRFGIDANQTAVSILDCEFLDCLVATRVLNNMFLTSSIYSSIYNNGLYGAIITNSAGQQGEEAWITENTFDRLSKSISVSNNNTRDGIIIENNNITNPIVVNGPTLGIHISNSYNSRVQSNDIFLSDMSYSAGIKVSGSNITHIADNTIYKSSVDDEADQIDNIAVHNTMGASLDCNHTSGGSTGIHVWGDCMGYYAENDISASTSGLYYGLYPSDGMAITGRQIHRANTWANGTMTNAAKHLSEDERLITQSQYIVDPRQGSQYRPDPIDSDSDEWFLNRESPDYNHHCFQYDSEEPYWKPFQNEGKVEAQMSHVFSLEGSNSLNVLDRDENLKNSHKKAPYSDSDVRLDIKDVHMYREWVSKWINGDLPMGEFTEGMRCNSLYKLYKMHLADPFANILTAEYINALPHEDVIQAFSDVEEAVFQHRTEPEQAFLHMLRERSMSFKNLTDTATPLTEIEAIEQESAEWYLAKTQGEEAMHQRLQQAQSMLSHINTSHPVLNNKIGLMSVQIRLLMGEEMSSELRQVLQTIAYQCPLSGGDAVYGARGLLEAYVVSEVVYQDFDLCQNVSPRFKGVVDTDFRVFPNPTQGVLHIESKQPITHLVILNAFGGVLEELQPAETHPDIDISRYPSGLYVVRMTTDGGKQYVHKIVKTE